MATAGLLLARRTAIQLFRVDPVPDRLARAGAGWWVPELPTVSERQAVRYSVPDECRPSGWLYGHREDGDPVAAARAGAQVLDLEGLANHRGSLFGSMGDQPAQKGFESALAERIGALDPARPVLVEAESSKVGERVVPPSLWAAMRAARRITVEAEPDVRAAYLTRAYADIVADPDRLDAVLVSLTRLQGHDRIQAWRGLAREGRVQDLAADLMRQHYDPRYAKQRDRDETGRVGTIRAERLDDAEIEALGARVAGMLSAP